ILHLDRGVWRGPAAGRRAYVLPGCPRPALRRCAMLSRSDSLADDGRTAEVPGRPLPVAGAEPGQEQSARQPKGEIVVDDYLRIDFDRNEVWAGGKKVSLTPTEYRLLYQLVSQPGRVLSFERLLTS